MLLAGRIGGAGRCGGRGRILRGTSASEMRIGRSGIDSMGELRLCSEADSLRMIFRMSMGLLLKSPPNEQALTAASEPGI